MKNCFLVVFTAVMLAILCSSCSDDDTVTVETHYGTLEYRHIDIEKLPLAVQDAIVNVDNLWYIITGQYNGQDIYVYDSYWSSDDKGEAITADGTKVPREVLVEIATAGRLKNWVCIFHGRYDVMPDFEPDSEE